MINKQILITLAILCMMALPAAAVSEPAIVSIGDGSGQVTIPIVIANSTNVGSVDVTLHYDTTIANVVSVGNGDMDSTFWNVENAGEVRIGAYQTNNPGLSGAFILANISFESAADSGSCQLEIDVTTFKDATPAGISMLYSVTNGTYTATSDGNGGNGGNGTYPPDPTPTPTISPTVTPTETPTTAPTPSPTKILPNGDNFDGKPGLSYLWIAILLLIVGCVVIVAMIIKNNKEE